MRQLDESLWVFDRPLTALGIHIGTRMTAIRLDDGGLFLHSPVEPDPRTLADLATLGPVRHVVAPSKVHHFFVAPWKPAFPDAVIWAAPGLPEKKPDLHFDRVLEADAPAAWAGQIAQHLTEGLPILGEVVFFHPSSRTLVLTDLAMNFVEPQGFMTKLWLKTIGPGAGFGVSWMLKRFVRDRAALRASFDRILEWDFERVITTHGVLLPRHGRRLLRQAWSWLES